MSETTIYLHGDGANWIRSGLEYLPNPVFVLDPCHKSKYLRQSVRDIGEKSAKKYEDCCFSPYWTGIRSVSPLFLRRFSKRTENEKKAEEALNYLSGYFDAIHTRYTNPEARNGNATEPQIQPYPFLPPFFPPYGMERNHAQTSRSRSRRWTIPPKKSNPRRCPFLEKKLKSKKRTTVPFSLGLPNPAQTVSLLARSGKVTPLFNALHPF